MHYILFDTEVRYRLLPFTHTRAVADVRCGIMTMRERWEHYLGANTSTLTEDYLQAIYSKKDVAADNAVYINAAIFATNELVAEIAQLAQGEKLIKNELLVAFRSNKDVPYKIIAEETAPYKANNCNGDLL